MTIKRTGIQVAIGWGGLGLAIYFMHSHPVLAIIFTCMAGFARTVRLRS